MAVSGTAVSGAAVSSAAVSSVVVSGAAVSGVAVSGATVSLARDDATAGRASVLANFYSRAFESILKVFRNARRRL